MDLSLGNRVFEIGEAKTREFEAEFPGMFVHPDSLLQSLDFFEILEHTAKHCSTPKAKEMVLALRPMRNLPLTLSALTLTNEALGLFERGHLLPASGYDLSTDTLPLLRVKNACLNADQFRELSGICEIYASIYRFCIEFKDMATTMAALFDFDPPLPQIAQSIHKALDPQGEVRSSASAALGRIRSDLGKARSAADRIFYRAKQRYLSKNILGDISETVYENRRVLAVQSAFKGQINGIIHGSSAKQSLLFVEPGECLEVNNEVAQLIDQERKEVRRILTELTGQISVYHPNLLAFTGLLERYDFIRAKAYFAFKNQCVLPQINRTGKLHLKHVHNPVLALHNRERGKKTIPFNMELDATDRLLVISGPNAGGKSVTLKTVGVCVAMLQSGLLIPADAQSNMCIFDKLMGDIGDSQSIENELSTYSSRLAKMRVFLEEANHQSLILVDEFGSGSDPDLGSALAEEVLERVHNSGALGVITTHYNRIKALAAHLSGALNANMAFDQRNFLPEYRLQIGEPGSSYTFEVAKRAGLSDDLIRAAKNRLERDKVRLDGLLTGIQQEKQRLKEERLKTQDELKSLKNLKQKQEETIKRLEEKLKRQTDMNEKSSLHLMWGKRFQSLVNEWLKARNKKDKQTVTERMVSMLSEQAGQIKSLNKKAEQKQKQQDEARMQKLLAIPIEVGDEVKLVGTRQKGVVLAIKNQKYQVQFGNVMTSLERDKIIKLVLPAENPSVPETKKEK